MRLLATTASAIALAILICPSGSAAETPGNSLSIVSPTTLSVTTKGDPPSATATVVVRNDGDAVSDVRFSAVGKDDATIDVTPSHRSIDANSAASFDLTFKPSDAQDEFKGALLVSAAGTAPGTLPLALAPAKDAASWLYLVIFLPLLGAVILIIARWLTFTEAGCGLKSRIGPANWDFSKSWGSSLTVVGALLGTILSAGALPEETVTSKATYAGLNLLFGVLILVAPLIYTATQSPKDVHRTKTLKEPQYQGYVVSFLIASAVTLWATVGELVTVVLLFREIQTSRSLPDAAVALMIALAVAAVLLLYFYSFRTLGWILKRQCDVPKLKEEKRAELEARVGPNMAPTEDQIVPELPAWSLL